VQLFALCVDGIATVIGSLLGCAPLAVYIESASGDHKSKAFVTFCDVG
jgi:xanthine/uracil/vitamin C permease (AzgA family)